MIAEPDPFRFKRLEKAIHQLIESPREQEELALLLGLEEIVPPNAGAGTVDQGPSPENFDSGDDSSVLRFTISAKQRELDVPAAAKPAPAGRSDDDRPPEGAPPRIKPPVRQVFQYSAITDSAVIPVRQQEVDEYFTRRLRQAPDPLDFLPGTDALRAAPVFLPAPG